MKNKYTIDGDKVYIELSSGKVAVIDIEDFDRANEFTGTWYASKKKNVFYAAGDVFGKGKKITILLHRWILNMTDKNIEVDHKFHNCMDNTRENLRVCTHSENMFNTRPTPNTTSKYKGVTWFKRDSKWKAQITYKYKNYNLGYFKDEIEAAKAYNKKAIELFGEFAYLNAV